MVQFHPFACGRPVFPAPVSKRLPFCHHTYSCLLCHKLIDYICVGYFWALYFGPLICVSIFKSISLRMLMHCDGPVASVCDPQGQPVQAAFCSDCLWSRVTLSAFGEWASWEQSCLQSPRPTLWRPQKLRKPVSGAAYASGKQRSEAKTLVFLPFPAGPVQRPAAISAE